MRDSAVDEARIELTSHQPKSLWKTLGRLLPMCFLLPFQLLRHGRNGLYFRHPSSTVNGRVSFGRFCEVGAHVFMNAGPDGIRIGRFSQINPLTSIVGNVHIGDRVLIAPSCSLAAGGHRFGKGIQPRFSGGSAPQSIHIEDDVWLGASVVVVGNITIGHGSVIAAGVTLDRDVPPHTLVRRGTQAFVFEPLR
ncbi:acyltransferase [Aquabacterium sp.]|uniref:acyltransferase n=1 Tax=Aquabacterium sp. TaxID=1872578 RepID=UPI0019925E58|nr:acyltransferase [Aquabacterium sp.]MBC7700860.1 acyltransferase [Aquabacterium sp.]